MELPARWVEGQAPKQADHFERPFRKGLWVFWQVVKISVKIWHNYSLWLEKWLETLFELLDFGSGWHVVVSNDFGKQRVVVLPSHWVSTAHWSPTGEPVGCDVGNFSDLWWRIARGFWSSSYLDFGNLRICLEKAESEVNLSFDFFMFKLGAARLFVNLWMYGVFLCWSCMFEMSTPTGAVIVLPTVLGNCRNMQKSLQVEV